MKKSLLALAVAGAFSGAAFAQSSVTVFGIVDTGFNYSKGDGNGNVKQLTNSGLNSSRLGFRGSEDLGGGLKANFWLEAGTIASDNGSLGGTNTNNQASGATGGGGLTFGRRSYVGLSGGFGEIRLGREYTPMFLQITGNDPFGTNGVGDTKIYATTGLSTTAAVQTTVRDSNGINYLTPGGIGGVYAHVAYAFGENNSQAANANDGRMIGGRLGWSGAGADVSVAYGKTDYLQSPTQGKYTVMGIAGSYNISGIKPMAQYVKHKVDYSTGTDPERTDWLVGIVWSIGATDLRASINRYDVKNTNNDGQQIAVGVVYNLSKRTALYGTYAQMDNKGTGTSFATGSVAATTLGGKTQGLDLGVRHSF